MNFKPKFYLRSPLRKNNNDNNNNNNTKQKAIGYLTIEWWH